MNNQQQQQRRKKKLAAPPQWPRYTDADAAVSAAARPMVPLPPLPSADQVVVEALKAEGIEEELARRAAIACDNQPERSMVLALSWRAAIQARGPSDSEAEIRRRLVHHQQAELALVAHSTNQVPDEWLPRVRNLLKRYPAATNELVREALVQHDGHAGKAAAMLANIKAPPPTMLVGSLEMKLSKWTFGWVGWAERWCASPSARTPCPHTRTPALAFTGAFTGHRFSQPGALAAGLGVALRQPDAIDHWTDAVADCQV